MRSGKRKLVGLAAVLTVGMFFVAGTVRAFVVKGASDAPNLLIDDRVLVNRAAYDLFVPFTDRSVLSWSNPERGDMVLCRVRGRGDSIRWLKRVVGVPGDTVELRGNQLWINGEPLEYSPLDHERFRHVSPENSLGEVIALESGAGMRHVVTYSPAPASELSDFGPVQVEEGRYFVLGDSRDNSLDSRSLGAVPREDVLGRYLGRIWRPSPD